MAANLPEGNGVFLMVGERSRSLNNQDIEAPPFVEYVLRNVAQLTRSKYLLVASIECMFEHKERTAEFSAELITRLEALGYKFDHDVRQALFIVRPHSEHGWIRLQKQFIAEPKTKRGKKH